MFLIGGVSDAQVLLIRSRSVLMVLIALGLIGLIASIVILVFLNVLMCFLM